MDVSNRSADHWSSGPGNDFARYRIPQHVAAVPGAVVVRSDRGVAAFEIDGGAQATGDAIRLRDLNSGGACLINGSALRSGDHIEIVDQNKVTQATIERVELSPVRDQFTVRIDAETSWAVEGMVASYEYWIRDRNGEIAHISRRWFRARESYGVQIPAGQSDLVVLAIAICLDHLVHDWN